MEASPRKKSGIKYCSSLGSQDHTVFGGSHAFPEGCLPSEARFCTFCNLRLQIPYFFDSLVSHPFRRLGHDCLWLMVGGYVFMESLSQLLSPEVVYLLPVGKREVFELGIVTGAPLPDKRWSPWTLWRETAGNREKSPKTLDLGRLAGQSVEHTATDLGVASLSPMLGVALTKKKTNIKPHKTLKCTVQQYLVHS